MFKRLALAAAAAAMSVCAYVEAADTVKIGAIFSVTGPAAFLGAPEAKTAQLRVDKLNASGGIAGRKVELIIKDSGGKPENAISMAKQLIEENEVLAIIGPSTSGESMAIKNICQEGKTILISCAAAETITTPVSSFVFKTPQKDSDAARWIFKTLQQKGLSDVGIVASNDGFGMAGKAQLEKLAPEYGIKVAISETYDKQETDLTGVLTKLKGAGVAAVINWSIVPAQALVAKNMKQIGLNVPLFQSHGFGNIKYVEAGGDAVNGCMFPGSLLLVASELPDSHPQKAVLLQYKKDYEEAFKEEASAFGGYAYDAILLLSDAIRRAGSTEPEKVRTALESTRGLPGSAGVFNMSAEDHNGLTMEAFQMLTVKDGKFAIYKP